MKQTQNQLERLYTLGQASKFIGYSDDYLLKKLPEFRVNGIVKGLRLRKDGSNLLPESDVVRLRDYLTEIVPVN